MCLQCNWHCLHIVHMFFFWTQNYNFISDLMETGIYRMCALKRIKYYTHKKVHIPCLLTVCAHWMQKPLMYPSQIVMYAFTHSFAVCVSHFTSFHFALKRACVWICITNTKMWYHLEWWELRVGEIIKKHTHTHTQSKRRNDRFDVWFFFVAFYCYRIHTTKCTPKTHSHTHAHCLRLFIYSFRFYPMLLSLFICNFPLRKVYLTTFYLDYKASHRLNTLWALIYTREKMFSC